MSQYILSFIQQPSSNVGLKKFILWGKHVYQFIQIPQSSKQATSSWCFLFMCLLMLVVDETYSRIILHFLHFTLFLFSLSSRKWLHTLDRLLHPIHPFLILYSFTASTKSSSISEKGSENKKYHKNISSAAFHNEDQPLG